MNKHFFPHPGSRTLPSGIYRIDGKTRTARRETSKKTVQNCRQSSSFFGGQQNVVSNNTMVSLDFFASFFDQEKDEGFCFFDQKKATQRQNARIKFKSKNKLLRS